MINIPSTLRISFRALKVNKMRSALTMFGIIIGVGAVIAMLAVGTGASKKIAEQISSMGSNLLMILPEQLHQEASEWVQAPNLLLPWQMQMPFRKNALQSRMLHLFSTELHRLFMDIRTGQQE